MNLFRLFLVLIPLLLASCSGKNDEPVTQEKNIPTELVTSREEESDVEEPGETDSTAPMNQEVSAEEEPTESREYPRATAVPGQPGFVHSPYNQRVIDVREIPSGTLAADPTYPMSEKKYFRVP